MDRSPSSTDLQPLIDLIRRLRGPGGCPWDQKQTLDDLRAYLLEEAHEVAAAIDGADLPALAEEAGDLLFQLVFIAELGREAGGLELAQVIAGIQRKMIERHPHVFGEASLPDPESVHRAWEERKLRQQAGGVSLLDGVAASVPSLLAAYRMTQKAAGVGFDWPGPEPVLEKVEEETGELRQALGQGQDASRERLRDEIGDLIFTLVNLARKLDIDPEAALARSNAKFRRRFRHVESALARRGQSLADASLEEMEELWEEAKGRATPTGRESGATSDGEGTRGDPDSQGTGNGKGQG